MKTEITYLVNQSVVILLLFLSGLSVVRMIEGITLHRQKVRCGIRVKMGMKDSITRGLFRLAVAYPAGLALWGIIGFGLLVIGIPLGTETIFLAYMLVYGYLGYHYLDTKKDFGVDRRRVRNFAIYATAFWVFALVCCCGIMSISVSNDSYYYYSLYPQTIAIDGSYMRSYDVFLTDVGQISAVIGTLPWFFGFEQTYGIQLALGLNLVAFFGLSIFDAVYSYMPGKTEIGISKRKVTALAAVLSAIMLLVASPFYVMSRWMLANIYFMTFFFIAFILTIKLGQESYVFFERDRLLLTIFVISMSMLRMEGGMMAGLLILCAMSLKIDNRVLLFNYTLPVLITEALYYAVIYLRLRVDPLYSFLGTANVIVMLGFMLGIVVYLKFIRGRRLMALQKHYTWALLLALAGGNGVIAFISPDRYLGNLRFFWINILKQNGWGDFVIFIPLLLLMIPSRVDLKKEIEFPVVFTVGYLLFTVALCWARDGTLRVGIGDSGNRVLMQIAPFVIYTITVLLIQRDYTERKREEEGNK
jgi:hypothetical protein